MRWSEADLNRKLDALEHTAADHLEDETLEFKGRPNGPDQLRKWAKEYAVAFANQGGGCLVVGVDDRKVGEGRPFEGIGEVDYYNLKRDVYDSTDPHILVDVEEIARAGKTLLAIRVSRGIPPHTDAGGRAWIRVGAHKVPLRGSMIARISGTRAIDPSAEIVEGTGIGDLDDSAISMGRRRLLESSTHSSLVSSGPEEILDALELEHKDGLTMAALLLFGRKQVLARVIPQHEMTVLRHRSATRYDRRLDLRGPIILDLVQVEEMLASSISLRTINPEGFTQLEMPSLSSEASREAVINAIAHRDYFPNHGIVVAIRSDRVEIQNPGGFLPGITPKNILRHAPARRNSKLADCLQKLNLANRSGVGVDRIFEELLRAGAKTPTYTGAIDSVTLSLPFTRDDDFAAWVLEFERDRDRLQLDDLIVIRHLIDAGSIDRWSAADRLQLDEGTAASHLARMRQDGLIVARGRGRGTAYALTRPLSERLRGQGITDADRDLESEGVRLRILSLLKERGRLSNAEIRAFSGYSRAQALAIEKRLEHEGAIEIRGKGRGAHIVLRE